MTPFPNPAKRVALASIAALALSTAAGVAGCNLTPQQQATGAAAVTTLAGLAAAHNATVATLVTQGALFCQKSSGIVAIAAPVAGSLVPQYASVIGASAAVVAQVCASLEAAAVPVPPPTNVPLNQVPVVTTPAAALLAAK